jgi:hypothetical protein
MDDLIAAKPSVEMHVVLMSEENDMTSLHYDHRKIVRQLKRITDVCIHLAMFDTEGCWTMALQPYIARHS